MNCQTQMTMSPTSVPANLELGTKRPPSVGGNSASKNTRTNRKGTKTETHYMLYNNRRQSIRMRFGVCATGMPMKTGLPSESHSLATIFQLSAATLATMEVVVVVANVALVANCFLFFLLLFLLLLLWHCIAHIIGNEKRRSIAGCI